MALSTFCLKAPSLNTGNMFAEATLFKDNEMKGTGRKPRKEIDELGADQKKKKRTK